MRLKAIIPAAIVAAATFGQIPAVATVEMPELTEAANAYRFAQQERAEQRHKQILAELYLINGPYGDIGREFSWAVEQWRPVVAAYFADDRVDWALRIIECESHGDPLAKNPNSSASGLFQHLASLWDERAANAGWAGADVFDPIANIAVAAWLLDNGGAGHWVCKASL